MTKPTDTVFLLVTYTKNPVFHKWARSHWTVCNLSFDRGVTGLRLEHAAKFARPCKRCFADGDLPRMAPVLSTNLLWKFG